MGTDDQNYVLTGEGNRMQLWSISHAQDCAVNSIDSIYRLDTWGELCIHLFARTFENPGFTHDEWIARKEDIRTYCWKQIQIHIAQP